MILDVFFAILKVFTFFAVGALAKVFNYFKEDDIQKFTHFTIDFLFPCLIFTSLLENFQTDKISELWPLPIIGFSIMAFNGILGFFLSRILFSKSSNDIKNTFHHFCISNNYGFIPIIIISTILSSEALANLFFHNVGTIIGHWTLGVAALAGFKPSAIKKTLFSPPLIACLLGIVAAFLKMKTFIPPFFLGILQTLGSIATPLALILIGATLVKKGVFSFVFPLILVVLVRLMVLPIVDFAVFSLLPISRMVFEIAVVVSCMPVAFTSSVLARRYGGSAEFAAGAAVVTTLVSIGTIPVLLSILLS